MVIFNDKTHLFLSGYNANGIRQNSSELLKHQNGQKTVKYPLKHILLQ